MCIYFCGDAYSFDKDMLTIALKQLIPQIDLDSFPSVCGIQIDDELFESLSNLWLVSAGMKRINELNSYMTPEMRKMQAKINRIRKQGKNNSATQGNAEYENTYMTLSYEFGYSQEQILSMTMYQVNKMLQYAGKSIQYKVSLIGAGNGLTKKVKFITER